MSARIDPKDAGFTLLEMIVALIIVALVSTIAVTSVGRSKKPPTLDRMAKSTHSLILRARQKAMLTGVLQRLKIDTQTNRIEIHGEKQTLSLPMSTSIKVTTATKLVSDQRAELQFNPDGSASGGTLEITDELGRSQSIRISWITGLPSFLSDNGQ